MKIAQIAPLYEAVPPRLYGGTERIVAHLCDALVDLGHDVTLFSSADADTRATLVPVRDQAIRLDPCPLKSGYAAHLSMLHELRRRADEFDILHFHVDLIHFPLFEAIAPRTVTTLHGRLDLKDLAEAYRRWPHYPLISISDSQRLPLADANWAATVHHGLAEELFHPAPAPRGDYLAFLGRIAPEKRPDRAIEIARRSGRRLRIAAKVDEADRVYFREEIEPLLSDPLVEFIGEIGDADKSEFLGNAAGLLFPIDWPEPFGLVMIEAMGCGTPVIAWACGSVPEVIDHGVSGFIVRSMDEAVAAVGQLPELDRGKIRRSFERRFSSRVMAQEYIRTYEKLAAASGWPARALAAE
ncbi:glycosyltransferase family 4 protein [Mycobacterium sp. KBS0706]|uniref:glycosyltransferase family 4 protein n=1 Tax=Mycobacterium sp. KBS0706 TaxID=2578109 RepID=UPI00110F72A0|nr:glycosyltransferase family 4 protein [Mycobacterium sp. KBS0706]TSD85815.1 glycosyltransferase family 4 protein [Mycobacterium sp. KBS0706]